MKVPATSMAARIMSTVTLADGSLNPRWSDFRAEASAQPRNQTADIQNSHLCVVFTVQTVPIMSMKPTAASSRITHSLLFKDRDPRSSSSVTAGAERRKEEFAIAALSFNHQRFVFTKIYDAKN
jgi:hypothetical protein